MDIRGLVKKWHSLNFVYYGISKLLLLSRPILVTSLRAQLFVVLSAIKKSFLANNGVIFDSGMSDLTVRIYVCSVAYPEYK